MTIEQIKEALNKGYKNFGLKDEALERVATSVETLVTDETDLDAFVKNKAVEALMKFEQADADRKRTAQKKQGEGEKQEANNGNQSQQQTQEGNSEISQLIKLMQEQNEQMRKQNEALTARLDALDAEKAKETAMAELDNFVNGWDYAGGFPQERDLAKRIAMKVYKAGGETMTGEQLIAAFREEFDPAVKAKGVTDFSQPFKSDGGGGNPEEKNAAFAAEIRAALSMDKGE